METKSAKLAIERAKDALAEGADPEDGQSGVKGRKRKPTPLMEAAKNGHAECCQLLIGRGADPEAVDSEGFSVGEWARQLGHAKAAAVVDSAALSRREARELDLGVGVPKGRRARGLRSL